ncbi:D-alanyl-D-alanine carboxypeptidase DacC [Alphaproteobacteria bacterium SO-S41]|nr:D-alanyl-D-alanine carboxypeptidase DacC [Alphaproteobacteria bacterium SO-S41]
MLRILFACLALALGLVAPAAAFETSAKTAILVDYESGAVLYDKDADKRIPPASMTKLMTAAVIFDMLKKGDITMDTKFKVSEKAWKMQGSKMFVELGTEIRVEDLLRGMIIQSGNDACIVLAEGISGSEEAFVALMNAKARELGMTNSLFQNTSGMPAENHYMSARDLVTVTRYIISSFPDYFHFYSEKEFTWKAGNGVKPGEGDQTTISQGNRNPLLYATPPGDGMKTGHTEEAGYCLTGTEQRGDQRMIMVVTGLTSMSERGTEAVRFMDAAFKEFRRIDVFAAGAVVTEAEVWNGEAEKVGLTVAEPLRLFVTPEARQGLKISYRYSAPIKAPIAQGQAVGEMTIEMPGQPPRTVPLVAATAVEETGIFGRIGNAISLNLFGYEPAT